jgi:isopenicillin N synthase-like dioxygenase
LTATPHQVTDPPDSAGDSVPERYSIAFFCNANKSVTLEPVLLPGGGGEAKYEPIRAIDYLTKRLTETISPSSDEKKDASS